MMMRRIGCWAAAVLLLAGCTAAPSAPSSAPTPTATTNSSDSPRVGTRSAELTTVPAPVPPVSVDIPDAGARVSVIPVGVQPDGLMELPADPGIGGWYRYGPAPTTDLGSTVIAAHVDSLEYGLGPFAALKSLPQGTRVIVGTADGASHEYVITSVASLPKTQLPVAELFDRSGPERLVLITCGGQFNYETLSYSDNIVAIAEPVS